MSMAVLHMEYQSMCQGYNTSGGLSRKPAPQPADRARHAGYV